MQAREVYREYIKALAERDVKVVLWHDVGDLTFDQIGVLIGVSRYRAHQIYARENAFQAKAGLTPAPG